MARKIIILETSPSIAGEIAFKYALWADVPAVRQTRYANANATTEVAGATVGELTAIKNGAVTERIGESRWPPGTTIAQIQAFLIAAFNAFQAEITALNLWARYGTSWDGTTWTPVNNG